MSAARTQCMVCSSTALTVFLERSDCPVLANRFYDSPAEARAAARAAITLACCDGCGTIQNIRFDEHAIHYGDGYENSLHYSPKFHAYSEQLAERLAEDGSLRGQEVVEIGCGRGEFLSLLCSRAQCAGTGFDPALESADCDQRNGSVRLLKREFGEIAGVTSATRLLICRHVLEHLARPRDLLLAVARAAQIASDLRFYVEVPNAEWMLENCSDMGCHIRTSTLFHGGVPGALAR